MSVVTNPTVNEVRQWFELKDVTITFNTESGSRYTLVARPKVGVVLIRENDGRVMRSDEIEVTFTSLRLQDKDGFAKWETTGVVSFFVLSN